LGIVFLRGVDKWSTASPSSHELGRDQFLLVLHFAIFFNRMARHNTSKNWSRPSSWDDGEAVLHLSSPRRKTIPSSQATTSARMTSITERWTHTVTPARSARTSDE